MKLFNIKINNNLLKNIFKFLLLALLIILCVYILYFTTLRSIEGFASKLDCSNCNVKPSSGNCISLYDFSYNFNIGDDETIDISFEKIDTNYIFCPYESKCTDPNMLSQDERRELFDTDSYTDYKDGINNITCCSNNSFYQDNVVNYRDFYNYMNDDLKINETCSKVRSTINEESNNIIAYRNDNDFQFDVIEDEDIQKKLVNEQDYRAIVQFCSSHDTTHSNYSEFVKNKEFDLSGIIFRRDISDTGHILDDPRLLKETNESTDKENSVQNIIDAQIPLSISMETVNDDVLDREVNNTDNSSRKIKEQNDILRNINTNLNKVEFFEKVKNAISELKKYYTSDISYNIYKYETYKLKSNSELEQINANYLLNEDEFYNCSGEIKSYKDYIAEFQDSNLTGEAYAKFGDPKIRYFGVLNDEGENIKTASEMTPATYGPSMDLAMELQRLQNVPPGGNAPTGIIDQYLRAINGFYEKQISNLMGPRSHSINNQLVFDNDTLETKESTFFVYETDPNNNYECQESITGNDKFKNCGPPAYYTEFKP